MPERPRLPKLLRFMALHALWGMVLGCGVLFALIWTDTFGLGRLLSQDGSGLATFVLFFQMALTFGAIQMGVAVMLLGDSKDDGPDSDPD
ncbi:hypothetical protein [Oceanomicrobium pacificus]|uniref:Uncharacterized protein n=1 Tax=Oceanomicrobium pacificus TaxID=2692916 RepID=A0A6B0TYM4_9RHOB|nr:hypothetical protein [Oceanomicrobium pacificus]MXU66103.1 hypothetical protein [Oceanomicrobium pacificus]